MSLPIVQVRQALLAALDGGRVVLSAPTGTGKSTEVPRWCSERYSRVLVIEPRRVACSSLAARVAQLDGTALGDRVGYQVRDEARRGEHTRLLFATPGIVLQQLDDIERYDVVIFDEFHERRLDTDLLLAWLVARGSNRLAVMSATLDGPGLAKHLDAEHVQLEVPMHPVEVRHVPGDAILPQREGLTARVLEALEQARPAPGDALVFLPGKAEIQALAERLSGSDFQPLSLHGELSLAEQSRVFEGTGRRRAILSTNVAETSLTVPGVGVVVDSGLVRRTRYREGRAQLALLPIAVDSAEQRKGRAGRTGPGLCLRLWSEQARLEARTPPEMLRESLVPLVLACAELGVEPEALPFVDSPPEHALAQAREELRNLGAFEPRGGITPLGRELFRLPIDAHLGRLLLAARETGCLDGMIDLVAVLAVNRPLFRGAPRLEEDDPDRGRDPALYVRSVRGDPDLEVQASGFVLAEARRHRKRLRRMFQRSGPAPSEPPDCEPLLTAALRADPRLAYVTRRRGRAHRFSNGGTEIELSRDSAAMRLFEEPEPEPGGAVPEALVVFELRAFAAGARGSRVMATCVHPVSLAHLAAEGLGRDRVAEVSLQKGELRAQVERVFARAVLHREQTEPTGALAREAVAALWLRGSLWPASLAQTRQRLLSRSLAARLAGTSRGRDLGFVQCETPPPLERWIVDRLEQLGLESGADLALLSQDDLVADDLPFELRGVLDAEFPRELSLGDATYAVEYDLDAGQVLLRLSRGYRDKPPPREYLPAFDGLKVCIEAGRTMHVLPARRRG